MSAVVFNVEWERTCARKCMPACMYVCAGAFNRVAGFYVDLRLSDLSHAFFKLVLM